MVSSDVLPTEMFVPLKRWTNSSIFGAIYLPSTPIGDSSDLAGDTGPAKRVTHGAFSKVRVKHICRKKLKKTAEVRLLKPTFWGINSP